MSKDETPWDWREFRRTALEYGIARDLNNAAQIARAMGEKGDSKVSRWFRGQARPTQPGVRQICDATGAPYPRMMWLSGNDPDNALGGRDTPAEAPTPSVVDELKAMLNSSRLSDQSRSDLERDLGRLVKTYREEMLSRKPA